MKLSKTQQELLDAMRAGKVVHYMRYMGRFNPVPYYFLSGSMKKCTAAAETLIKKGLAEHYTKSGYSDDAILRIIKP